MSQHCSKRGGGVVVMARVRARARCGAGSRMGARAMDGNGTLPSWVGGRASEKPSHHWLGLYSAIQQPQSLTVPQLGSLLYSSFTVMYSQFTATIQFIHSYVQSIHSHYTVNSQFQYSQFTATIQFIYSFIQSIYSHYTVQSQPVYSQLQLLYSSLTITCTV